MPPGPALRRQRGLDRHEGGDRVVVLVKLRPRYLREQLLDALGSLEGALEVEWEH